MTEELYTIADPTAAADFAEGLGKERAQLIVYYGQGGDARTRLIDLPDGAEVTFGRSRGTTVHVDSDRVSRTHARIERRGREITVEDLGSRNGSRLNGQLIEGTTRLSSGDEVGVGPITAVLTLTTAVARRTAVGSTSFRGRGQGRSSAAGSSSFQPWGRIASAMSGSVYPASRRTPM